MGRESPYRESFPNLFALAFVKVVSANGGCFSLSFETCVVVHVLKGIFKTALSIFGLIWLSNDALQTGFRIYIYICNILFQDLTAAKNVFNMVCT